MKVLGLIPARGGSKGVPGKNLRLLGGRPLILWTIEAALKAEQVDRVVVSSDSEEILETARKAGAETPFTRPAELARDDTPALPVALHALHELGRKGWRPDAVAWLQPTSPLRTAAHIDACLKLLEPDAVDSVVSVCRVEHTKGPHSVMTLEQGRLKPFLEYDEKRNMRQLKPLVYHRNGGVYAVKIDCLLNKQSLFGDVVAAYVMDRASSVDIDEELDLILAQRLLELRETGR